MSSTCLSRSWISVTPAYIDASIHLNDLFNLLERHDALQVIFDLDEAVHDRIDAVVVVLHYVAFQRESESKLSN